MQGYAGTPTNVNGLTFDANIDIGAAGVQFPRLQRFFVSVDSRADPFTNKPLKGQLPPELVGERRDAAGGSHPDDARDGRPPADRRPGVDLGAGVDPLSLVINYNRALVGASLYDPLSGLIVFGIPTERAEVQARQDAHDRRSPPTTRSRRTSTRSATT